jgi:hypothetical protein
MTTYRRTDLANELHVGTSAVSHWIKRGLPVTPSGLVDRERALKWIAQNIEPQVSASGVSRGATRAAELLRKRKCKQDEFVPPKQTHRPKNGNGHDEFANPAAMRARRDRAIAEKLERENEIAGGQLVRVADVAAELAAEYSVVRAKLLSLPSKCAPQVKYCESVEAVRALLEREILAILTELSGDKEPDEDQDKEP